MDKLIETLSYKEDDDLNICEEIEVAYQRDMENLVPYDEDYWTKYQSYEGTEIAKKINDGRLKVVFDHGGLEARVVDIGIGSGEFIKRRNKEVRRTVGTDVNPHAIKWLQEENIYCNDFYLYRHFTMWDVLEHCPDPKYYLGQIQKDSYLYVSIPIYPKLKRVRESRHYRPNEHLYHFTEDGFIKYMYHYGFTLKDKRDFEIKAGRDSIYTFVFKKDKLDNQGLLDDYARLHQKRYYGFSSENYRDIISDIVFKNDVKSILDYGCGRSALVKYFWRDGERYVEGYDPAIPELSEIKRKEYDLVICSDVLEHINFFDLFDTLERISKLSKRAVLTIATQPARACLSDGSNAHVTVFPKKWWKRFLLKFYKTATEIKDDGYDFTVEVER